MSAFPDTSLEPVDQQAARLLSRVPNPETYQEQPFYLDLKAECDTLTEAIAKMSSQMSEPWRSADRVWLKQCRFNLNASRARLKTARHLIASITQIASTLANSKRAEIVNAAHVALVATKQRAKTERTAMGNADQLVFLAAFKKTVKAELGEARYLKLVAQANRLKDSQESAK